MNEETFQARLSEARAMIEELPEPDRGRLMNLLEETCERHYGLKDTCDRLCNAVNEAQITMKYLIFDCEATRRERDALRRLLNEPEEE